MAKAQEKLKPAERLLMIDVLEEALERAKESPSLDVHRVAVKRYKRDLINSLRALNPKGYYRAS